MGMDYLITFRSVTYAQRAERTLRNAGIRCGLRRTPKMLAQRGCGYCLTVRRQDAVAAVALLREREVQFGKVYGPDAAGGMEERAL